MKIHLKNTGRIKKSPSSGRMSEKQRDEYFLMDVFEAVSRGNIMLKKELAITRKVNRLNR